MPSEYEKIRLKNLEENKKILSQLGILNPFKPLPRISIKSGPPKRKRPAEDTPQRPAKKIIVSTPTEGYGSIQGERRRSSRILGQAAPSPKEIDEDVSKWVEDEENPRQRVEPNRPNVYGAISGIEVGTVWMTRMEACTAGVQRPTVAGIHGGLEGAYSIALSGGYEDDIDLGECFTYTGEGGRDLKGTKVNPKNLRTAPQSKDQTLTRGNLALSISVETGNPVRVLRGYKLRSPYAPEEGYRYDGLYKVEKYWYTIGLSGFGVFKFALKRLEDQPPPPWTYDEDSQNLGSEGDENSQDSCLESSPPSMPVSKAPSETSSVTDDSPKKLIMEENNNEVKFDMLEKEDKEEEVKKEGDKQENEEKEKVKQIEDKKEIIENDEDKKREDEQKDEEEKEKKEKDKGTEEAEGAAKSSSPREPVKDKVMIEDKQEIKAKDEDKKREDEQKDQEEKEKDKGTEEAEGAAKSSSPREPVKDKVVKDKVRKDKNCMGSKNNYDIKRYFIAYKKDKVVGNQEITSTEETPDHPRDKENVCSN